MSAVLIDSHGAAIAITDAEHTELVNHLQILQAKEDDSSVSVLISIIQAALNQFTFRRVTGEAITAKTALAAVVFSAMADNAFDSEYPGMLIESHANPAEPLEDAELETLWNTLKMLRRGGWFAEWLRFRVSYMDSATDPKQRFPSPLDIIGTFHEDIDQFENRTAITCELITMRPDLFSPAPQPEALTPVSKPAPESKPRPNRKRKAA